MPPVLMKQIFPGVRYMKNFSLKSLSRRASRLFLILSLAICSLQLGLGEAQAVSVYGTDASWSGSRQIGNGLTGNGGYATSQFTISWNIVDNFNGTLTYTYTLDNFEGIQGGGVSHFTLDLSDNYDSKTITEATINGTSIAPGDIEYGNFNEPSNSPVYLLVGAVKFDVGSGSDPLTYSFVSNRLPVWHFAFVKSGLTNYAYTSGLDNPVSGNILDFIATPDGQVPVPEPTTLLLTGSALLGLIGRGRMAVKKVGVS